MATTQEAPPTPEEKYSREVDFAGARLEVLPLYDRVVPGFANKVPVLFQFVTGKDPQPKRDPFSLAVVLDLSGSMQGSRLNSCKAALEQLIDSADDNDTLSLVAYESKARTIFEEVRCGGDGARRDMKDKVAALDAGGATNLYGGLLAGYELLRRQADAPNKHLFLLSDGQVTEGRIQKTDAILQAVADWDEKIPILSYGIGEGFNEALMSPLGQVHRGSHYFYITDAASIERFIAKGMRALTSAVARNIHLQVTPSSPGVFFPDHMIDGVSFPLVRESSVIQYLVEVEVRPEMPSHAPITGEAGFEVIEPKAARSEGAMPPQTEVRLGFKWEVDGFRLLKEQHGHLGFQVTTDRSFRKHESPEVRTYLDVKRACELRRTAAGSTEARTLCEQALKLFVGRLEHDRFGFAAEWANKTRALLEDSSLWCGTGAGAGVAGTAAGAGVAKHLGCAYKPVEEEDEEDEMDFDLFG
mmetsp:Transcript_13333/g.42165  ORF Transcript_13333/g.42165 Transcript_13333/m.42165 type:complete len:471 (+) Transcript_13333:184-1596(+)